MATHGRIQEICNLVDDDETLKSWIRRAHEGWITGREFVALAHYFIYKPDRKDQSSEKIVEDWIRIVNWGLGKRSVIPYSKHSYMPLTLEELEKIDKDDWLISVESADHLVESLNLGAFCATTIDYLFEEIYPEETKKQTPAKESQQRKHTTEYIGIMEEAIQEFWENHDPNRPPKKDQVVSWLEQKGLSTSLAESMDTIIRTPEARKGGQKPRTSKIE